MLATTRLFWQTIAKQGICILPFRNINGSVCLRQLDLKGIFPPISTPFNNDEQLGINFEKLAMNMKFYDKSPLRGK